MVQVSTAAKDAGIFLGEVAVTPRVFGDLGVETPRVLIVVFRETPRVQVDEYVMNPRETYVQADETPQAQPYRVQNRTPRPYRFVSRAGKRKGRAGTIFRRAKFGGRSRRVKKERF